MGPFLAETNLCILGAWLWSSDLPAWFIAVCCSACHFLVVLLCISIVCFPFTAVRGSMWWPLGHTHPVFLPTSNFHRLVTQWMCVVHPCGMWGSLLPPHQLLCCAVFLLGYQMAHKCTVIAESGGGNYWTAVKGRGEGRGGREWEVLVSTLCDRHLGFADWEYISVLPSKASQISSYWGIDIYMHMNQWRRKQVMVFKLGEQVGGKV